MTVEETTPAAASDVKALAEDLVALSNEQRLRLLHFLTRPHYGEEIAEHLGVSRQAAIKHIERLAERGFVRTMNGRRARGPVVEYQVIPQRIFALSHDLSELARLEPVGGPLMRRLDPTVQLDDAAQPEGQETTAPEGSPAQVVVLESPNTGRPFPLEANARRWTIGREEDRDLRLSHDPFISARHAEIQRSSVGFDLVDLFSANGTFVNFGRIPRGGRTPLRVGDIITVGRTSLVLQVP